MTSLGQIKGAICPSNSPLTLAHAEDKGIGDQGSFTQPCLQTFSAWSCVQGIVFNTYPWTSSPCGLLYPLLRHSENLGGFLETSNPKAVGSRGDKLMRLDSWGWDYKLSEAHSEGFTSHSAFRFQIPFPSTYNILIHSEFYWETLGVNLFTIKERVGFGALGDFGRFIES